MLGHFISLAHLSSRIFGVNPADFAKCRTLEEQCRFFSERFSPLFDKRPVRWITSLPVSLYGLGIPPAQYEELAEGRHMADVLRERLGKLCCDHTLEENYFARQAFARSYGRKGGALPPYLDCKNWNTVRDLSGRVSVRNISVTDMLRDSPASTVDRIVLLDAQDWMTDTQLNALWSAINHAASPEALVIFRTAAKASPLEGRLDRQLLSRWTADAARAGKLAQRDRSAIYGGFHIYKRVT